MKPIMDVAVKKAPIRAWAGRMPTSVSGIGAMMTSGIDEGTEPANHKHIDQHQHRGECESKIAKDFDGDVPFAIPLHGVVVSRFGHGGVDSARACNPPEA